MATSATGRVLRRGTTRPLLAAYGTLAVLSAGLTVLSWALLAGVITRLFERRSTPGQELLVLGGVLAAWAARAGLTALRDLLSARTSRRVRSELRLEVARTVVRRGPAAVADQRAGELVSVATEAVQGLDPLLARFLPTAVTAAVVAPLLAAAVLVLDPLSGVILVVTGPLVVVLLWLVGTHADQAARERWESLARLSALLTDTLRVLPTLVTSGRGPGTGRWLATLSEDYRTATMRVLRKAFLSGFVLELGASLCTALVAVTVGIRLFQGELDLTPALLVLLLTPEFFAPLRALGADHHARLEAAPAATRLYAVLDAPTAPPGSRAVPATPPRIELVGVTAGYRGRTVLAGVDLCLPAGSSTALVGSSGAGKSTLAALVLGFRSADRGEILVDGVPLSELDPDAWRDRVGYVGERPWLSAGSIADNVRLGRPRAGDAEVAEALRRASATEFVARLRDGADTLLGEDGAVLSGGQRLRVAIARAFVADAPVLVLDEPTSQLDVDTEAAVLAALDDLAAGRTVLTITHRAAPLGRVDRIASLVDGTVTVREGAGRCRS